MIGKRRCGIYVKWNISHNKRWNTAICDKMDGSWDCHAKWNKSDRKSWESYDFTYMWDIKLKVTNEQDEQKLIDTDNSLVVTGGKGGRGR